MGKDRRESRQTHQEREVARSGFRGSPTRERRKSAFFSQAASSSTTTLLALKGSQKQSQPSFGWLPLERRRARGGRRPIFVGPTRTWDAAHFHPSPSCWGSRTGAPHITSSCTPVRICTKRFPASHPRPPPPGAWVARVVFPAICPREGGKPLQTKRKQGDLI